MERKKKKKKGKKMEKIFTSKFLAIFNLFQTFSRSIKDHVKVKHQLQSIKLSYL